MSTGTFLLLGLAFGYAVLPYSVLFLVATWRWDRRPLGPRLLTASAVGLALLVLVAVPIVSWRLDAYVLFHAVLAGAAAVGVVLVVRRGERSPARDRRDGTDLLGPAIVLLALLVRLAPLLAGGETLGGNDARFHSVLAHKILVEGTLSSTWDPVAPVLVVYPRGIHVLCGFLARTAGTEVHQAFNALFPLVGAMTVALIGSLGATVFRSRAAGRLAAAAYGFLPLWGSLDYFRWGGLPNAVGMLLLCLVATAVLQGASEDPDESRAARRVAALAGGLAVAAVTLVHHYSFLVAGIVLLFGLLVSPAGHPRRSVFTTGAVGAVLAVPWIVVRYLRFVGEIGTTSVLVFREPPLTLWDCVRSLSPAFVALFAIAWIASRSRVWNAERVFVTSWFASLLVAFVFLEYLYRAGSLIVTGGEDFFTAFTPSRMATDLAYPMSILIGGLAVSETWRRGRRLWIAAVVVLALATSTYAWRQQVRVGVYDDVAAAGLWIREHTAEDSLVVGRLPHLAYLSWREVARPALPASEPRNHPDIAWKDEMRGLPDWAAWHGRTGRPVYFVGVEGPPPPPLPRVFRSGRVSVWELSSVPPGAAP